MKRLIVSLALGIFSSIMFAQSAPAPQNIQTKEMVSPVPSTVIIKNYRTQLYRATPAGDRLIIRDLRRHLRHEIRVERHLRRELRRLRRERALRPPIR